ncbi:DinB superfamily protein [Georgenia satyanarayanai]|uniref:DinB superfamily protein n=2 Tax=Georgenia satyanarayanai TaxID=860221 RepID=A0A2Y9AL63_9MICO|nr:DinB family protein [Georgenia satyanarayanai]SSA44058.1 DinB superfamily protein [Georgenia satyanarayanai]
MPGMAIDPDTKDWTWVLQRPCPECGTEAAAHTPATTAQVLEDAVVRWEAVLRRPDVARRPDGSTWSPLEYAAHVRDVCGVFRERLHLILTEDDPTFPNWDQDAAAVAGRYGEQEPAAVAEELAVNARAVGADFDAVPQDRWERSGLRSNGSPFTVRTLSQYFLHDVLHHLHDVGG